MLLPAYVIECASREELESLKNDLLYWQNSTLKMMMNLNEKGNTHMIAHNYVVMSCNFPVRYSSQDGYSFS